VSGSFGGGLRMARMKEVSLEERFIFMEELSGDGVDKGERYMRKIAP
jgi:hypothetical protein